MAVATQKAQSMRVDRTRKLSNRLAMATMFVVALGLVFGELYGEDLVDGNGEDAGRNTAAQLDNYEATIAADPDNYEALWKAARLAIRLGASSRGETRSSMYFRAEIYARRAVSANPGDPEGHFVLAHALARVGEVSGWRLRIQHAGEIRRQALAALELDPHHAGALHIVGMWHAEVMRTSAVQRFLAAKLLGGEELELANWNDAVRYLEQAVATEPDHFSHRLDLGMIYVDLDNTAKAREQLEWVVRTPARGIDDVRHKRQAEQALLELRN